MRGERHDAQATLPLSESQKTIVFLRSTKGEFKIEHYRGNRYGRIQMEEVKVQKALEDAAQEGRIDDMKKIMEGSSGTFNMFDVLDARPTGDIPQR